MAKRAIERTKRRVRSVTVSKIESFQIGDMLRTLKKKKVQKRVKNKTVRKYLRDLAYSTPKRKTKKVVKVVSKN